jgi:3-hydroxyacyl-[acyl-carrier-protein] dehydratase
MPAAQHPNVPVIDPTSLDLKTIVADQDAIRGVNPHRHELELLTAITQVDPARHFIVGYKDLTDSEFWVRGHMPGFPLMPGVLMCEAAAQLCAYYGTTQGITGHRMMGLGGIEMAKFRRMVRPGDRLVLIGHGLKVDRRLMRFHVRGFVQSDEAFETVVIGVPLRTEG